MGDIVATEIEEYAAAHSKPGPPLLAELAQATRQREGSSARMLTGQLEGRLLHFLVALVQPRLVVELGLFTGYSALSMAEAMPEDGRLVSCELDPGRAAFARGWLDRSPHGHKVDIRVGPALDTVLALEPGSIDLSFVDADKENYPRYYEELLARTRPGGLIVLDNMLWSGEVLEPRDEESRSLAATNERIVSDERVDNLLLTVRDGVQLVRVR